VFTPGFLGEPIGRAGSFLFNKIISPVFPGPITIDPKSPIAILEKEGPVLKFLSQPEDYRVVLVGDEGGTDRTGINEIK
jgi:hypothetical protein